MENLRGLQTQSRDGDDELLIPVYKSQTEPNLYNQRAGVKRGLKSSPQTPEHEIPLPGTSPFLQYLFR